MKALKDLVATGATEGIKSKELKSSRNMFDNIRLPIFCYTLNRLEHEQKILEKGNEMDSEGLLKRRTTCNDETKDLNESNNAAEDDNMCVNLEYCG